MVASFVDDTRAALICAGRHHETWDLKLHEALTADGVADCLETGQSLSIPRSLY